MPDLLTAEFRAVMAGFEPFGAKPRLTVGVSGGADSTALALLTKEWAAERGGEVLALIVDHGLRAGSGAEADITRQRLEARAIPARVLTLTGLGGAKLQETARRARHAALAEATRDAACLFLLLGHHAADQSETVAMRALRGNSGLEAMAGWTARNDAVLLRPLLGIAPERLRAFLQQRNTQWVEDPSNQDQRFERVRLRLAGVNAAPQDPARRREAEHAAAAFLAREAILRPEGFAILRPDSCPPAALAALLRTIGGRQYGPRQEAVMQLAGKLRPATLGGVRLMKAGRFGPGWLLVRETGACAPPVPARRGEIWDGRFRLLDEVDDGLCGAAGAEAALFRNVSNLPAAVLAALPCIRPAGGSCAKPRLAKAIFAPPAPAAALPFPSLPFGPF